MKARVLVVMLFLFLSASFATAQDEAILQKAYAGALLVSSFSQDKYYLPANDVNLLVGARTKFKIASGLLHTRIMYDFKHRGSTHLWWEKEIFFLDVNVGYMPRPISAINRPDPISADAHFEPISRAVIPGPATGIMGKFLLPKVRSDVRLGLYQTGKDMMEVNFSISQRNINRFIKEVGISGYVANHKGYEGNQIGGLALNADCWRFNLMGFAGEEASSTKIYSCFAGLNLEKETVLYVNLMKRSSEVEKAELGLTRDVWDEAELGLTRTISEKVSAIPVKYMFGLSYTYSDIRPNVINFFLQIWADR